MKVYFLDDLNHNAGDMLSGPILEYLGIKVEYVGRKERGKLLAVGSVMSSLRRRDVVWGTGCIRDKPIISPPGVRFLAVRGPMTRKLIQRAEVPEIYGDPALLLPLIYQPDMTKRHKVGLVPHYIDKGIPSTGDRHFIDIQTDWRAVVDEIASCESIISSSLHGLIIAEAYGIPARWEVYSNNVIGGEFKFRDYLAGTGRQPQGPGDFPPIENLDKIQNRLVQALKMWYSKITI